MKKQAELARESEIAGHAEYEKKRHSELESERLRNAEEQQDERDLQRRARALEPVLKAALLPDRIEDREALFHQASQVLAHMRPTAGGLDGAEGFTSEIELGEREQNVHHDAGGYNRHALADRLVAVGTRVGFTAVARFVAVHLPDHLHVAA